MVLRNLILYLFILLPNITWGQQLSFKGQLVDTVTIESYSGYYHFDEKGTTSGQGDSFIISYDKSNDNYLVSDYKRKFSTSTITPNGSHEKVKLFSKYKGRVVKKNILDSLLHSLSVKYKRPLHSNIGLSEQTFYRLTDEKHIRHIAKIYKAEWHFKMGYTSKSKNESIFSGCQNLDSFDTFLSEFDSSGYIMVTDVSDVINIYIKTGSKQFSFEGKYSNIFKQPWYDHSDTSKLFATSILNFNINHYLYEVLPDDFQGKKTISYPALVNPYIKWYLKRRGVIYLSD